MEAHDKSQLDPPRRLLVDLVEELDLDYANLSRAIDRNHAYLQQYVKRGIPAMLPEEVRERLAPKLGVTPAALRSGQRAPRARTPGEFAEVVELDVRASAGAGSVIEYEGEAHTWGFPSHWMRAELNAGPSDLYIITIEGDSMPGILEPGDKALVNIGDRIPSPPGLFIIHDGLGLVAKRIEHIDGSDPPRIRLMSTNADYKTYERTLEEAHIMGRVVGKWKRL